jgi:DNA-directed RNA polymerase beta' subunit
MRASTMYSANNIVNVKSVDFGLYTDAEITALAVTDITKTDYKIEQGSIYDPLMGVIDKADRQLCKTCNLSYAACPGHYGKIDLHTYIIHPLYVQDVIKILNCICYDCKNLIISFDRMRLNELNKLHGTSRFKEILGFVDKTTHCEHCSIPKNKYAYIDGVVRAYTYRDKEQSVNISNEYIYKIFEKISPETIEIMGWTSGNKPIDFLMNKYLVIPTCARPYVKSYKGNCDDSISQKYIDIVKVANALKDETSEKIINEGIEKIESNIHLMIDNNNGKYKQVNTRPIQSIKDRLTGKGGLFRHNLLGKRNDFTGRSVIGPDPMLRADEIAIPEYFSRTLTYPDIVTVYNIDKLSKMIKDNRAINVIRNKNMMNVAYFNSTIPFYKTNGFILKPGDIVHRTIIGRGSVDIQITTANEKSFNLSKGDTVTREGKLNKDIVIPERVCFFEEPSDIIIRNGKRLIELNAKWIHGDIVIRNGVQLDIQYFSNPNFKLQLGDIVERFLETGDYVLTGRQPTLHKGSLLGRRIRIIRNDPTRSINAGREIQTIRLNLAQTKSLNADF